MYLSDCILSSSSGSYIIRLILAARRQEREWGTLSTSGYSTLLAKGNLPENVTETKWAIEDLPLLESTAQIDAALQEWVFPSTAVQEADWYPILATLFYTLRLPQ